MPLKHNQHAAKQSISLLLSPLGPCLSNTHMSHVNIKHPYIWQGEVSSCYCLHCRHDSLTRIRVMYVYAENKHTYMCSIHTNTARNLSGTLPTACPADNPHAHACTHKHAHTCTHKLTHRNLHNAHFMYKHILYTDVNFDISLAHSGLFRHNPSGRRSWQKTRRNPDTDIGNHTFVPVRARTHTPTPTHIMRKHSLTKRPAQSYCHAKM